jgi:hypothetical protein
MSRDQPETTATNRNDSPANAVFVLAGLLLAAGGNMGTDWFFGPILTVGGLSLAWLGFSRTGLISRHLSSRNTQRVIYVGYAVLCAILISDMTIRYRKAGNVAAQLPSKMNIQHNEGDNNINVNGANTVNVNPPATKEPDWILVPANEPDPLSVKATIPSTAMKVFLGGNIAWTRKMGFVRVLEIGGEHILSIKKTPKGLFVSANLWREDGRELAIIRDNQFIHNRNNYYPRPPEMPDAHELQVFGKSGELLWKVRYINEQSIVIQGIFYSPNHAPVRATETYMEFVGIDWRLSGNNVHEVSEPNGVMFRYN